MRTKTRTILMLDPSADARAVASAEAVRAEALTTAQLGALYRALRAEEVL